MKTQDTQTNHNHHMIGNQLRRKNLCPEDIPEKFRKDIVINIEAIRIGKRHKELHSNVKCVGCNKWKLVRNQRIRENLRKKGILYRCSSCGGKSKGIIIDPELLEKIKDEYMSNDISWEKLAKKYNISEDALRKKANAGLLCKIKRTNKRKQEYELAKNDLEKYLEKI